MWWCNIMAQQYKAYGYSYSNVRQSLFASIAALRSVHIIIIAR